MSPWSHLNGADEVRFDNSFLIQSGKQYLKMITDQVRLGTSCRVEGGQGQSSNGLPNTEDHGMLSDQEKVLTRSGSSMSDRKSISTGPRSSSNTGLDSAKVYRMAATTVARPVGFASLMRFCTLVRIAAAAGTVLLT